MALEFVNTINTKNDRNIGTPPTRLAATHGERDHRTCK